MTSTMSPEVATRSHAAADAAVAALHARPPARCPRCGPTASWMGPGPTGFWRCSRCWQDTRPDPPTADEERDARLRARRAVEAEDQAERLAAQRRLLSVETMRDQRPFAALAPGMHAALLHRFDPTRYAATAAARQWLEGGTLCHLGTRVLEVTGRFGDDPFSLGQHELAMRMLRAGSWEWTPVSTRGDGFQTTKDFPALLDQVTRITFLDAYTDAPRTFAAWTRGIEIESFRVTYLTNPGFPTLLPVPEEGEYTRHGPSGPAEPLHVLAYGRIVALTRQALLADDVLTFARMTQMLGVAAAAMESDVTYGLLTSNPVTADGNALFSAAHKNLMPPAALSADSLAAATSALAAQTANDTALHLRAAFLLVGTALGPAARQLALATTLQAMPDSGVVTVVQDDRIPGTDWYVCCDPRQHDTLVTAHLTASPTPELFVRDGWEIDAREYKGRDTFGAAVADWRGLVKTPGA